MVMRQPMHTYDNVKHPDRNRHEIYVQSVIVKG